MKKFCFFLLCFFFFSVKAFSQAADPIQSLKERVKEHTLKNGMKILILERSIAPLVSYHMLFRAGGVDEQTGKTGLAHLFEHMLFKGSQIVGTKDYKKEKVILDAIDKVAQEIIAEELKGAKADLQKLESLKKKMEELEQEHQRWVIPAEFDELYQQHGAEGLNAYTSQDRTGFVVNLPSNKWELWPILESDRMAYPVLREFYKEREVVMEERRMRYENSPRGKIWENFISASYLAHPYGSPTIGWSSDLKRLTVKDAENFFRTYYAPNNATVAIVGDVQAERVIEKLEKYFVKVHSQPPPPEVFTEEPLQEGERRLIIHFDAEPSLLMGFHKPNPPHPDNFAMEMIQELLSRGRTSRFHKNIVEKKIAISAWASNGNPGERYPNLIVFGGAPRKPHGNADLEKAIVKELEKLKKERVSKKELKKIQNQIEADFIRELASNSGMASQLAYAQAILGDWRYLFQYLEGIRKVTPDDILRVANQYFVRKNRTVAYLQRENKDE